MNAEQLFLRAPVGLASRLRIILYRMLGMQVGQQNRIEHGGRVRRCDQIVLGRNNTFTQGAWLWPEDRKANVKRIVVGDHNYFNHNFKIDACNFVEIGDNNMVGPNVFITDSDHATSIDQTPKAGDMQKGKVKIGNDCWLGAGAIVLKDVSLGDGCIVGAGTVVTKSFPPNSIIAGVPGKLVKQRT